MEEQAADLARPVEIVAEHEDLRVEGPPQLFAMLAVGADAIAVEGPALTDLAENLAGAAHLARFGVLEHHQIKLVGGIFAVAGEAGLGAIELGAQRLAVGRQIGEAAPVSFAIS